MSSHPIPGKKPAVSKDQGKKEAISRPLISRSGIRYNVTLSGVLLVFTLLAVTAMVVPAEGMPSGKETSPSAVLSVREGGVPGARPEEGHYPVRLAESRANPVGRRQAKAALTIAEYYERAVPVTEPLLPDGLRVMRWSRSSSAGSSAPVITSPCLHYDPGEFSRAFFNPPHARRLREFFAESGADAAKVSNLLRACSQGGNEIVAVFDEGYMMVTNPSEKANYIFLIDKEMREKLLNLSR